MSTCLACAQSLGCSDPADLAVPRSFYATQGFSYVQECPPGYKCGGGGSSVVLRINQQNVPPVIVPPGTRVLRLQGCRYMITRTVSLDISIADLAAVAASMQAEWAQQQVNCGGGPPPSFPPTVPPPTVGPSVVCLTLSNTEQSYTAQCPAGNCGPSVTKTVAAGTYTRRVCGLSSSAILGIQSLLDAQALQSATNQAIAALVCGGMVGNAYIASGGVCPNAPWITVPLIEVPACTFTSANPGDQDKVDAEASASLQNQLAAALSAAGCTCSYPTMTAGPYGTVTIPAGCVYQFNWSWNSPFFITITGPFTFDPVVQYKTFNGVTYHPSTCSILYPFSYAGPPLKQCGFPP